MDEHSHYQKTLLGQIALQWEGHRRVLDIGGGDGTIAQAIHDMLGSEVTSIDVANRFRRDLTISTAVYDGATIPFEGGSFDAITLNNVLHHVPVGCRASLLRECARVCNGPIYIKDHLCGSRLDRVRLQILDVLGNLPHGGMVKASYMMEDDWANLYAATGYTRAFTDSARPYRSGAFAAMFPNTLETFFKLVRNGH